MSKIKVALLDDWSRLALSSADWSSLLDCEVTSFPRKIKSEEELIDTLMEYEVVVAMRERTAFNATTLKKLKNLKLLVTTGMRNYSIDMTAARALGIIVSGTEMLSHVTYEHTWALIMAVARDIVKENRAMHAGGWQEGIGNDLKHKTLGILGLGHQGQDISRIARAFDMRVIAWSPNLTAEKAAQHGATLVDKATLLSTSDILTIHIVLSERTRHLLGEKELSLMKPTSFLVNTSRGPIVDEAALVHVLRKGAIAGAALDVFDVEPLPEEHPLRSLDNVILTGHTGYLSREFFRFVYGKVVENIRGWQQGKPINVLNGAKL